MNPAVKEEINIVMVGNERAGKTSVIQYYAQGAAKDDTSPTVGLDYETRIIEIDGVMVKIHLWDVSGQESFLWLAKKHIKEADGFLFVYDVTDQESFKGIPRWLNLVKRHERGPGIPRVLFGNKLDLRHKQCVTYAQAREYAVPEGFQHLEGSSWTGKNVKCAYYMLAREILHYRKLGTIRELGMLSEPLPERTDVRIHDDPDAVVEDGPEYAHLFKILVLGDSRSGKTSLRYRFCRNYFSQEYRATGGMEYGTRTVLIDGDRVKLQIWDVSGDDVYDAMRKSYYRGANAFMIAYDVTNKGSFDHAEKILKELDMYEQSDAPKVLVGNKVDLGEKKRVSYSTVREWADGWRIPILEASARTGANVDTSFLKLAGALKRQLAPWKQVYNFS